MLRASRQHAAVVILSLASLSSGCNPQQSNRVSDKLDQTPPPGQNQPSADAPPPDGSAAPPISRYTLSSVPSDHNPLVATVNGQSITLHELATVLIPQHGLTAIQQLIANKAIQQTLAERSLTLTQAEVNTEYFASLDFLARSAGLPPNPDAQKNAREQRDLLDRVLAQQGISMEEYMLGIWRNAALRKLVGSPADPPEERIQDLFRRQAGVQVRIRQIACRSLAEAQNVRARLDDGRDFAEVARLVSHDAASAQLGGLVPPFTAQDETVPALLRQAAFALAAQPGTVSNPIRAGDFFLIIRVEEVIPPENLSYEQARPQLLSQLRDLLIREQMARIQAEILQNADIQIHEPIIKKQYDEALKQRDAAE